MYETVFLTLKPFIKSLEIINNVILLQIKTFDKIPKHTIQFINIKRHYLLILSQVLCVTRSRFCPIETHIQ